MTSSKPQALDLSQLRIAVVHEWLVDYSGSERVVEQILNVLPHADLFAVVEFLPDHLRGFIRNKPVRTTFIQKLPRAAKHYRHYLPLMPLAVEQHDLSGYDIVISSSHAVAKGVLTGPDQLHVSYVHSPMRYAWDLQHQYLTEAGLTRGIKGWLVKWILHRLRVWDSRTGNGVDAFAANSQFIARRIWKVYRRRATVIYPPVDTAGFSLRESKEDFYLVASRMVPYKKVPLVVEAFRLMPERRLVVIGDGPDFGRVKALAGPNVTLLGYQPTEVLRDYMQRAKAFVFAAEEDFGIVPVEAQSCGTPVIALGRGGVVESIRPTQPDPTGVFFSEQSVEAIIQAVEQFESMQPRPSPLSCHRNAQRFSQRAFQDTFRQFVTEQWGQFRRSNADTPRGDEEVSIG